MIKDAGSKHVAAIAAEMKDLAVRAMASSRRMSIWWHRQPLESGHVWLKQFDAVINPPQALIVAVGAGEKRAIVDGDTIQIAIVMSATGSFGHRVIDGAIGAEFMAACRRIIEQPLSMLA